MTQLQFSRGLQGLPQGGGGHTPVRLQTGPSGVVCTLMEESRHCQSHPVLLKVRTRLAWCYWHPVTGLRSPLLRRCVSPYTCCTFWADPLFLHHVWKCFVCTQYKGKKDTFQCWISQHWWLVYFNDLTFILQKTNTIMWVKNHFVNSHVTKPNDAFASCYAIC